jgi:hypothetical protein
MGISLNADGSATSTDTGLTSSPSGSGTTDQCKDDHNNHNRADADKLQAELNKPLDESNPNLGSCCSVSDLYSGTPKTTSPEEEEEEEENNENYIAQSDIKKIAGEVIKNTATGLIEQQGKVPIPGDKTEMVMKNMKEISEALDGVNNGTKDGNLMREVFDNLDNPGVINQEMIDRNYRRDTRGSLQEEIEETANKVFDK